MIRHLPSMVRHLPALCLCLCVARPVAAASIVTWEASGELATSTYNGFEFTGLVPDPGTAFHFTMSFDPASSVPSFGSPPGSNCYFVSADASITLGTTTLGMGGFGVTNGRLPGTNCSPGSGETQFALFVDDNVVAPWPSAELWFMELWYFDNPNAFSSTPPPNGAGFQIRGDGAALMTGRLNLQAVDTPEQPTPVPEPATMTLFGFGLAAAVWRRRRA
jgi:hypothetical protein